MAPAIRDSLWDVVMGRRYGNSLWEKLSRYRDLIMTFDYIKQLWNFMERLKNCEMADSLLQNLVLLVLVSD